MLNIIQLEIIRHDILDPDLSRRNGLDCHGINIPITEHGLKGQLLVKGHADRKRHLSRSAVAHEHNCRSLFGCLNQLGSRDLGSCRLDGEIAAFPFCKALNLRNRILLFSIDHVVRAKLLCLLQPLFDHIHHDHP